MTKENINWRSFDDQSDININGQWNLPATPTMYIIDHRGTIRHKWVGKPSEKSVDAALESLIQETEEVSTVK